MRFNEWLDSQDEMVEIGQYDLVKRAWNAALEEAAEYLDHIDAKTVRELKEPE